MATPLARADLVRLRAVASGLVGDGFRDAELAVAGLVAVGAVAPVPTLALLPRVRGAGALEVEDLADEARVLVRLASLRGEPHLVHRSMAATMLDATEAPRRAATFQLAQDLGIPIPVLDVIRGHVVETLHAHGPLTPGEISRILEKKVPEGETLNRLLALLSVEGTLVRATNKGDWSRNAFTYALLASWVPEAAEPGDTPAAIRALADAYVRAYGPAAPEDFARWSGIPLDDAAPAFADLHGDFHECDGRVLIGYPVHARRLSEAAGAPAGRLAFLPMNDPLATAHVPGTGAVPAEAAPFVFDASGRSAPVIALDGEAVALWEAFPSRRRLGLRYAPFPNAPPDLGHSLEEAVTFLADFHNVTEANVERVPLPPPLAERPPWAVALPLRAVPEEPQGPP